jgi:hypothetical protein
VLFPNLCPDLNEILYKISAYLFSICEFCDIQHTEGHTVLGGICGSTFGHSVKPYDILKVKNALVKAVYCVTEYSGCSHINERIVNSYM